MELIVRKIHTLLIKKPQTVAVAESCTGGLISKLLTDHPGSSAYFLLGIVAYHNTMKNRLLGVKNNILLQKGAVSKETAISLARAVRRIANSDFSLGVTGIAGPSGGSLQKPVGTVYIAACAPNKTTCKRFQFNGNRKAIREKTAFKALELLNTLIEVESKPKLKKSA
jgi:PncC family amidohydrolase